MKRRHFEILAVLFIFVFFAFSTVSANEQPGYWSITGGEFWGHPNPDDTYSIAFNYSAIGGPQFVKIEPVIYWSFFQPATSRVVATKENIGLLGNNDDRPRFVDWWKKESAESKELHYIKNRAGAVYQTETSVPGAITPQFTTSYGCAGCHTSIDNSGEIKFSGNVDLQSTGSYIIQLKGYLPDGSSQTIAEIRRVLERYIFELDSVIPVENGFQMTYVCFPILGNSLEENTPVEVQFMGTYQSTLILGEDGNYRCSILVPSDSWNYNGLNDTFFDIEGDLWRQHTEIQYPDPLKLPWYRPSQYNLAF